MTGIACPLCGEDDFDAIGLVLHIDHWCHGAKEAREALQREWATRRGETQLALAAGSRRAKTAEPVECEASQSGLPKEGNAQKDAA